MALVARLAVVAGAAAGSGVSEPLSYHGRRAFVRGLARSIQDEVAHLEAKERVELLTIVLDLIMPKDDAELARCFALLEDLDKEREASEPELPL